jgi:hypothetical protein
MSEQWDALVDGTLHVLNESVCESGLVPNWWVPSDAASLTRVEKEAALKLHGDAWSPGSTTCTFSNTNASEFGAEATRTAWRIALDVLWYGDDTSRTLAGRIANRFTDEWKSATGSGPAVVDTSGCSANHIFHHWETEMFMVAPIATALGASLHGLTLSERNTTALQERMVVLDAMETEMRNFEIRDRRDYYPGSWATIATLTLANMMRKPAFVDDLGPEATTDSPSPPPISPPISPPMSPPMGPSPPTVPPLPLLPPTVDELALAITGGSLGGGVLLLVLFCCCACVCLQYRARTVHWRRQRKAWKQAEEEKAERKERAMIEASLNVQIARA